MQSIEGELRQKLGQCIPETIREELFTDLIRQFQTYQQKGIWNSLDIQYRQAESRAQQIQLRLEKDLQSFGFASQSIDAALVNFFRCCEEKEQLVAAETELERLKSQGAILRHQLDQFQGQQDLLSQIEGKIINLLAEANINVERGKVEEGMLRFNEGLASHRQWIDAQSRVNQIQTQIDEYQQGIIRAQSTVKAKQATLSRFREQLQEKLSGWLTDGFSDETLSQLDVELNAYNSAQLEIDKLQGQVKQLQLQAQAIQRDLDNWLEKAETTKQLEIEILQAIHETGIQTDRTSVETALDHFSEAFQNFSRWQEAKRAYDSAVSAQQSMQTTRSKLETEESSLASRITEILKQHPEWKNLSAKDKAEVYEQQVTKLDRQVSQERDRLVRLQDAMNKSTAKLRHLAEIDEEIYLVSKEIQELTRFSDALELASSELTIAAQEFQKIFAPQLERIVDPGLEQITKGRYQKVSIDADSLNVQVLAPEQNDFVETAQLSTGTRDLIYLILRIGITELMSKSGEKLPLLLDDPLVEFDRVRQRNCLEYLKNLSEQTQIFLFTKDDHIKDWYHDGNLDASRCKLIELV